MDQVGTYSMIVCCSVYLIIGATGYFGCLDATQNNILINFPFLLPPTTTMGSDGKIVQVQNIDPLMAFAQGAIALTIVFAYPLNIFPCRFTIEMMLFTEWRPNRIRFFALTTFLVALSLLLAVLVPGIAVVFGLMGATTSAFVCYILPALFALKIYIEPQWSFRKMKAAALVVGGVIIGVLGTAVTIWQLVMPLPNS